MLFTQRHTVFVQQSMKELLLCEYYIWPAKFARSSTLLSLIWFKLPWLHLAVILRRCVQNSTKPSPVISISPYLLLVPYNPPNENGSLRHKINKILSWIATTASHFIILPGHWYTNVDANHTRFEIWLEIFSMATMGSVDAGSIAKWTCVLNRKCRLKWRYTIYR